MPARPAADPPQPSTRQLRAAQRGDDQSIAEILERCRPYLLAIAHDQVPVDLRPKGAVSDIVQETIIEAWRDFGRFDGRSVADLHAWLRRILRHNAIDLERRYRRTGSRRVAREVPLTRLAGSTTDAPDALVSREPSPSAQARRREEAERLEAALARIEPHYAEVIRRRHHDGLDFAAIGALLGGKTPNAARLLWLRALEALELALESPDESTFGPNRGTARPAHR